MGGNNGSRPPLAVQERLSVARRPAVLESPQAKQFLDELSSQLGDRLELAVREQVNTQVAPRLDDMEADIRRVSRDLKRTGSTSNLPVHVPEDKAALQLQARNRVD